VKGCQPDDDAVVVAESPAVRGQEGKGVSPDGTGFALEMSSTCCQVCWSAGSGQLKHAHGLLLTNCCMWTYDRGPNALCLLRPTHLLNCTLYLDGLMVSTMPSAAVRVAGWRATTDCPTRSGRGMSVGTSPPTPPASYTARTRSLHTVQQRTL
jgi:hypothetical protein